MNSGDIVLVSTVDFSNGKIENIRLVLTCRMIDKQEKTFRGSSLMKRILNKRIRINVSVDVKTMLTMLLVGVFCVSAAFATPVLASQIQATIASHITVRYNGEVQHMRDANGNTVHPLVFNGTTYLPLRAAADMFGVPVNWIGETNTIELGNTARATMGEASPPVVQGVRLREVARLLTIGSGGGEWINDPNLIPSRVDASGNARAYTDAIRFPTEGRSVNTTIRWDGSFSHISFDVSATGSSGVTVRLSSSNSSRVDPIWEQLIIPGETIRVSDLNVSDFGRDPLWVTVSSANREEGYAWILDPVLR